MLVHTRTAVRLIEESEAARTGDAHCAIVAALQGEDADRYFPDLAGREPPRPDAAED